MNEQLIGTDVYCRIVLLPVSGQNQEICYASNCPINYFRTITRYVCPILSSVSLHSKIFQGRSRSRAPGAIAIARDASAIA